MSHAAGWERAASAGIFCMDRTTRPRSLPRVPGVLVRV